MFTGLLPPLASVPPPPPAAARRGGGQRHPGQGSGRGRGREPLSLPSGSSRWWPGGRGRARGRGRFAGGGYLFALQCASNHFITLVGAAGQESSSRRERNWAIQTSGRQPFLKMAFSASGLLSFLQASYAVLGGSVSSPGYSC